MSRWLTGGALLGLLVYFLPALYGEGYNMINHVLIADYHYVVNKFPVAIDHNATHLVILVFVLLTTFKVIGLSLTLHAGGIGQGCLHLPCLREPCRVMCWL